MTNEEMLFKNSIALLTSGYLNGENVDVEDIVRIFRDMADDYEEENKKILSKVLS